MYDCIDQCIQHERALKRKAIEIEIEIAFLFTLFSDSAIDRVGELFVAGRKSSCCC